MASRKSLVLAREAKTKGAKTVLETLTTECIDIFENVLPAALKEFYWCELRVREAFQKAQFIQENITKIPSHYAQGIYLKISSTSNQHRVFPYLRDGSYRIFSNISERLDIAFEINPTLNPELKEIIHVFFLQIFGEASFQRAKFYTNLFLKHYKETFTIISRESSILTSMELQAKLQIALTKGSERENVIRSILKSTNSTHSALADSTYARTLVVLMLGNSDCDFIPEILNKLTHEMRSRDGTWDSELVDSYFTQMDRDILRRAFQNTENLGHPELLQLFIEYIDSYASQAKLKYKMPQLESLNVAQYNGTGNSVVKKWIFLDSVEFCFSSWKDLLRKTTFGVLRNRKNAMEEQLRLLEQRSLNFNKEFWKDILDSP